MFSREDLFCSVDDLCQGFEPTWRRQRLGFGLKQRNRLRSLSLSEIMTILIDFHFVNILGGLIAYCHQSKKPSIALDHNLLLPA
ncbi:MAG: hypothetical protein RBJ76_02525 [Stenomitos frigidus ULC029]